ncbi:hypothetical protein GCM10025734_23310 [Kitasatospora paranensis]
MHTDAPPARLLAHAAARLGLPDCSITTTGGRVLATATTTTPPTVAAAAGHGSEPASAVPVGGAGDSPFDGWLLRPQNRPDPAAATVLRGLAELLGPQAARARAVAAARRRGAARLLDLLERDSPGCRTRWPPSACPNRPHSPRSRPGSTAGRRCGRPPRWPRHWSGRARRSRPRRTAGRVPPPWSRPRRRR